jgi:hypothetical protein
MCGEHELATVRVALIAGVLLVATGLVLVTPDQLGTVDTAIQHDVTVAKTKYAKVLDCLQVHRNALLTSEEFDDLPVRRFPKRDGRP